MSHDTSSSDTKTLLELAHDASQTEDEVKPDESLEVKDMTMETEDEKGKGTGSEVKNNINESESKDVKDSEHNVEDIRLAIHDSERVTSDVPLSVRNHVDKSVEAIEDDNPDETAALLGKDNNMCVDGVTSETEIDDRIDDMTRR